VYTRCSACHTVHPVNAAVLARSGGQYRCGKCKKVCNALDALFDEWPGAGEKPKAAGDIPILGMSIDLEKASKSRLIPGGEASEGDPDTEFEGPGRRGRLVRVSWISMAVVLIAVLALEISDFKGQSLLEAPVVQSVKSSLGIQNPAGTEPFRDLSSIHLVSRELKVHPSRPDSLLLTATIVNRANQTQPWPDLEVVLLDAGERVLSRLHFAPRNYLSTGEWRGSGMTPQAHLPLELDLPDPGDAAVGFELIFH
jgi:predicted Zn finger-like uncharacterized protein